MKKAVIYCRISRDDGQEELGVKRQEADCRALCEREGFEVAAVLVDNDISAYKRKVRPAYNSMLALLADGEINVVVAWHPDRLTRHPRELEDLIDTLEGARATIRTVTAGEYDLATPTGRQVARIVGAIAKGESEHKGARLRRKHEELAQRGKLAGGGTRPYGYNDDRMTVNKAEAKIVKEMAHRLLAGDTLRSVCIDLNRREVPTVSGTPWRTNVIRRIVTSGHHAGLRVHRTGTFKAQWPAIIDEADHRRLVAIFTDTKRYRGAGRRYLLTGAARCGLCDALLVARPRSDGRKCLVCATGPGFKGCGKIRTLTEPVDELVTEAVLTRLDSVDLARLVAPADHDDGDDLEELRRIESRLGELGEMWAAGELTRASFVGAQSALKADQQAVTDRMRSRSTIDPFAAYAGTQGALRASWPEMSVDQQRAVVAAVVESVVVSPAVRGRNTFDPSRVSIRWRV